MDDGAPVFANVELEGRKLIVEVNSATRAQQATQQISDWLGERVETPLTEIQTLAQVMTDGATRDEPDLSSEIPPHEMEHIVHDLLTREYVRALDEAVPALGNKTPRALARARTGRPQVAEWLKYLENGSAKTGESDPMASYNFGWMWDELGISELRR
ncbi:hypothetical protein [Qipengyuania sp. ASV99]|uniref:hypothetical protein n=1 Tax=Qipengyuania sp. ASV99 TaxID=3399681 RepID=UPI003A4C5457